MRFFGFLLLFLFFSACRKDTPLTPVNQQASDIELAFSPVVNKQDRIKGDTAYHSNGVGDKFTVSLFKYYISNVVFVKSDNTVYTEPESYHLIAHFGGSESFTVRDVPHGDYKKLRFLIGVDSARNVSGAQTGDLDVGKQMFWDWSTGYIFYKLEGNYMAMSGITGEYGFHIGGFSGPESTLEYVEVDLKGASVGNGTITRVELLADAAAVFDRPQRLSFDEYYRTPPSTTRDKMQSTNYRDMFTVDQILTSKK